MMNEFKMKLMAANVPIFPNIGRAARAGSKLLDYYQRRK
jgi:hypothetical protein